MARMPDDLLEVEDGAEPLERMKRPPGQLAVADADQARAPRSRTAA